MVTSNYGSPPYILGFVGHTIRVVVLENPHANIPFPHVFRGPFDQRWSWRDGWCTPTWIGETAERCFASGVPFHLL